jgi:hypothetical protein
MYGQIWVLGCLALNWAVVLLGESVDEKLSIVPDAQIVIHADKIVIITLCKSAHGHVDALLGFLVFIAYGDGSGVEGKIAVAFQDSD